jgi:hypothetical protein
MNNGPHNLRAAQAALTKLHARGDSPKTLKTAKRQRACSFIDEFQFASGRHVDMAGCEPGFLERGTRIKYGLASQLEDEGLLRSFDGGGRFGKLYTLTPRGKDLCFEFSPFKIFDPAKFGNKTIDHTLAAQRFTLRALGHNFTSWFKGDRGNGGDSKGSKRPDIIFNRENGEFWAIEIERSAKKGRELDSFVEACVDYKRNEYDGIIIAFESDSLQGYYANQFRERVSSVKSWSHEEGEGWSCERYDINPSIWSRVFFVMVDDWETFFRPVVPKGFENVPMPEGLRMGRC